MKKFIVSALFIINSFICFAQETEVIEMEEVVEVSEVEEDEEYDERIPFAVIEESPIFPGCEKLDKKLHRKCFVDSINEYANKNFNSGLANELGIEPGKKRVYVSFLIIADGSIKNIQARGPYKKLEEEAIRVVRTLPKVIPGKQQGKPSITRYFLPITIMVDKKKAKKTIKN